MSYTGIQPQFAVINYDKFAPSETQHEFELTFRAGSSKALDVYVNGQWKEPDRDYTVFGTTINLNVPIGEGDELFVRYRAIEGLYAQLDQAVIDSIGNIRIELVDYIEQIQEELDTFRTTSNIFQVEVRDSFITINERVDIEIGTVRNDLIQEVERIDLDIEAERDRISQEVERIDLDIEAERDRISQEVDRIDLDIVGVRDDLTQSVERIELDIDGVRDEVAQSVERIDLDIEAERERITQEVERLDTDIALDRSRLRTLETNSRTQIANIEDSNAEIIQSIADAAIRREQLRDKQRLNERLIDAVVEIDPDTGTIINKAFAYTDDSFNQAELLIDGANAQIQAAVQRITLNEEEVEDLRTEFTLLPAQVTAIATSVSTNVVAEALSALQPAYVFNFFENAQGWVAVNGTLTDSNGSRIDVTLGDIENSDVEYDAEDNPAIRLDIERISGDGWVGDVIVEYSDQTTQTFSGAIEEVEGNIRILRNVDLRGISGYEGTVVRLRLILGATTADEFIIRNITIGKVDAQTQEISDISARVAQAELDINANTGAINQRVTVTRYEDDQESGLLVTSSNFSQTLDADAGYGAIQGTVSQINSDGTIAKANAAGLFIDTYEGTFTAYVEQTDLTLGNFASAINQLNVDVSPQGALAQSITQLESSLDTERGRIDAQALTIQEIETDVAGNSSAISGLTTRVENVETESSASTQLLQQSELDTEGNTKATVLLEARIDDAENELDAQSQLILDARTDIDGNTSAVNSLTTRVGDVENEAAASTLLLSQSELDSEGNTKATIALESRVDDAESDISAQAGLILQAQNDIGDNTTAIGGLTTRVGDVETQSQASTDLLTSSEFDAQGNTIATGLLSARVTDNENEIDAQAGLLVQARTDIDGNTTAIGGITTRVTDVENQSAASANIIAESGLDENGNTKATIELAADITNIEENYATNTFVSTELDAARGSIRNQSLRITRLDSNQTDALIEQTNALADYASYIAGQTDVRVNFARAVNELRTDVSPEGALAQSITDLEASVATESGRITATNTLLQQALVDIDGNAQSLTVLDNRVGNAEGALSAQGQLLIDAELDSEGNTKATVQLATNVGDLENSVNANTLLLQQSELDVEGNTKATTAIQSQVNDLENEYSATAQLILDSELDADGNTKATAQIVSRIDNEETGLNALSGLILQAQNDIDGNTSAIGGLSTRVDNVETESSASTLLLQQSELDAQGNTKATVLLEARIDDAENEIDAQSQLILDARSDIDGNTSAIGSLGTRVTNTENQSQASTDLLLASELDSEGNTKATTILSARVDDAENDISAQAGLILQAQNDIGDNTTAIGGLTTRVDNVETESSASTLLLQQSELDAEGNTKATVLLEARIDDAENEIDAQSQLILDARTDINGNTSAIGGLTTRVGDVETQSQASTDLLTSSELDSEGNTKATAILSARVDDAESDISAQAGLILQAQNNIGGNTSAIAGLDTRVSDVESESAASASIIALSELDEDGNTKATIQLAADVTFIEENYATTSTVNTELDAVRGTIRNTSFRIGVLDNRQEDALIAQTNALADYASYIAGQTDVRVNFARAVNELRTDVSPEGALAQSITDLEASVATESGRITATNTLLQQARVDIDGNAQSLTVLESQVDKLDEDYSATAKLVLDSGLDEDGTTKATSAIFALIDDEKTGLNALSGLITEVSEDVDGLFARAFLGVDVNGQVTGINIFGDEQESVIAFQAGSVVYTDLDNNPVILFDIEENRYVFQGQIIADAGLFGGLVRGGAIAIGGSIEEPNFEVDTDGNISVKQGSINLGGGVFTVDNAGNMEASNAKISGDITVENGSIDLGSGKFTVDNAGNLKATGAEISGKLSTTDINGDYRFSLNPSAATPLQYAKLDSFGDVEKEVFSVSNDGEAFFGGGLAPSTVEASSLSENAKKAINPHYLGAAENFSASNVNSIIPDGDSVTSTVFTQLKAGNKVELSVRFADYVETGAITQTDSVYTVTLQRRTGQFGAFQNIASRQVTYFGWAATYVMVGGVATTEIDNPAGRSHTLNFNFTDEIATDNNHITYRVLVTRNTSGTGTSGGLRLRYFNADTIAFATNELVGTNSAAGWYHTDKETGFTIYTASRMRSSTGISTITFPKAFEQVFGCTLGYSIPNDTSNRNAPRYENLTNTGVDVRFTDSRPNSVITVMVTGRMAV